MKRPIAVLDAETDPFKRDRVPAPFIWGFYDGTQYRTWTDTGDMVAFLREYDGVVFAHNGGRFDWHFVLPYLDEYQPVMLINGRIAKFQLGLAECRDSYCLIPVPLGAYKKDDIDYSIMEAGARDKPANARKIAEYLKSDCVYLWDLVTGFVDRYGLQLTQAGASMKQWRKISREAGLLDIPETDAGFYSEFAPFYAGGRVQCFQSGVIEKPFSVWDINSAYPFAMLQSHPYSPNYSRIEGYRRGADFHIVDCVSLGALPWRDEYGGLHFPNDGTTGERRTYYVTRWELEAAKETRTVRNVRVRESITFMGHVSFAPYVEHFYAERAKCKAAGDEAGSLFAKLFMNSLYGKFAANPENYREYMVVPMDVICGLDAVGWQYSGEFGPWGLAEKPLDRHKARYYNVATGASITGYVRAMLWRTICGGQGVLYCDTDSIAAEALAVPLGGDLGAWKHEGDFDRAGIGGKKVYVFRGVPGSDADNEKWRKMSYLQRLPQPDGREYKLASKGVRLSIDNIFKVAANESVIYYPEQPTFSPKHEPRFIPRKVVNTVKIA